MAEKKYKVVGGHPIFVKGDYKNLYLLDNDGDRITLNQFSSDKRYRITVEEEIPVTETVWKWTVWEKKGIKCLTVTTSYYTEEEVKKCFSHLRTYRIEDTKSERNIKS